MWERMMSPQNTTKYDYDIVGLGPDDLDSSSKAWMISAIIGVVLFLCVVGYCICKKCSKKPAD
jgi:hypothetical protein